MEIPNEALFIIIPLIVAILAAFFVQTSEDKASTIVRVSKVILAVSWLAVVGLGIYTAVQAW